MYRDIAMKIIDTDRTVIAMKIIDTDRTAIAMKIIDTDRVVTINIMMTIMIVMVTKITMDMEMASRMADTKINEHSTTKTFTKTIT